MVPNQKWSLRQLARFVQQELSTSQKAEGAASILARKSVVSYFLAGKALFLARQKLKGGRQWCEWQKKNNITRTSAFEAIRLFEAAGSKKAVLGLTLTAAKEKYGVIAIREKKASVQHEVTAKSAQSAPSLKLVQQEPVVEESRPDPFGTPLTYYGGKQRMTGDLISLLPPDYQKMTYCEVFGGGGALLFAKPPSKIEIYNDIDGAAVNFFKVLRDHREELQRRLRLTPYSRAEFEECCRTWESIGDPIEKARRYYVHIMMSFGKLFGGSWSYRLNQNCTPGFVNKIEKFEAAAERLRQVYIENADFRALIPRFDSDHTIFYCDPTYLWETRTSGGKKTKYRFEMNSKDHIELLGLLKQIKGKVLLSGYQSPLYRKHLKGWDKWDKRMQCVVSGQSQRVETVWANFDLHAIPKERAA